MNMTGDPNHRNKTTMFGFDASYPCPNNTSNFNEGMPNTGVAMSLPSSIEGRTHSLFSSANSSPYNSANIPNPMLFNQGYFSPSTSTANVMPSNGFDFRVPQPSTSTDYSSQLSASPSSNLAFAYRFNWPQDVKPTFTATSANHYHFNNSYISKPLSGTFGCKRKTASPPLVTVKQHITEERMAEHMAKLHISSQTASSIESQPVRERRLYMCEEMQRLQTESIIPAQILEKVNRPCTALVPWRPPVISALHKENNNNEEEPDNNHKEQLESNIMDMDS